MRPVRGAFLNIKNLWLKPSGRLLKRARHVAWLNDSWADKRWPDNRHVIQIQQCTTPISHNAPFCYKM